MLQGSSSMLTSQSGFVAIFGLPFVSRQSAFAPIPRLHYCQQRLQRHHLIRRLAIDGETSFLLASGRRALSLTSVGDRDQQHSEQKAGFRPPRPQDDDGHVVDVASIQGLIDAGALQIMKRRDDYVDRRTDGYTEPLEIYVLGTSHASPASAKDVGKVIRAVRPQSVVVELCKSRAGLMADAEDGQASSPLAMTGENLATTLIRSIRLGGQSTAILRAVLAWAAQGSMAETGATTQAAMYGEFRAAREYAEEIEAQIVLGDRPIEITLQRAWEALTAEEKSELGRTLAQLAFDRVRGHSSGSDKRNGVTDDAATAAEMKLRESARSGNIEDDAVDALVTALADRFPSVVGPLVYERDRYLAWTLKRSRAVCGQRRVVGVLGRGHLSGVMRAMAADKGGDTLIFKELAGPMAGTSKARRRQDMAQLAARLAAETAAGYALWQLYKSVTG